MRFRFHRKKKNIQKWHRWYAWRPVWVGDCLVWLEYVERKLVSAGAYDPDFYWTYRYTED